MRLVVVHYHLFKNAGTTLDWILRRHFGDAHAKVEGDVPWATLTPDRLLRFVRDNPGVRAVSSHQARLPVPDVDDVTFAPLVFLRHPLDRVGSVYAFERRQPASSPGPGVRVARETDLKGYVRWRLAEGNGAVIKNYQVVHLAGREYDMRTACATTADLATALERVKRLPFLGFVERFDESVGRLREFLHDVCGPIDTTYTVRNRSPERTGSLDERLEDLRSALGADLYRELVDRNALDLELYTGAREHLQGQPGCRKAS